MVVSLVVYTCLMLFRVEAEFQSCVCTAAWAAFQKACQICSRPGQHCAVCLYKLQVITVYLLTNPRYLLLLASHTGAHTGAAWMALGPALSLGHYTSCENGPVLIPEAV